MKNPPWTRNYSGRTIPGEITNRISGGTQIINFINWPPLSIIIILLATTRDLPWFKFVEHSNGMLVGLGFCPTRSGRDGIGQSNLIMSRVVVGTQRGTQCSFVAGTNNELQKTRKRHQLNQLSDFICPMSIMSPSGCCCGVFVSSFWMAVNPPINKITAETGKSMNFNYALGE